MDGKRLIEKIRLRNILSFGDKGEEITLEPLNIINSATVGKMSGCKPVSGSSIQISGGGSG
jgi:hypothetical protein